MNRLQRLWSRGAGAESLSLTLQQNQESEVMEQLISESIVISDQLTAAVEEVNQSIGELTQIADQSAETEGQLREASIKAMERIEETFSTLQEVAASAEQISEMAEQLDRQSKSANEDVLQARRLLTNTDQVMTDLHTYNSAMDKHIRD